MAGSKDRPAEPVRAALAAPRPAVGAEPGSGYSWSRFFCRRGRYGGDRSRTRAASSDVDRVHPAYQIRDRRHRHHPCRDGYFSDVALGVGRLSRTGCYLLRDGLDFDACGRYELADSPVELPPPVEIFQGSQQPARDYAKTPDLQ